MIGAIVMKFGARCGLDAINRRDLDFLERWMADDVVFGVPGRPPIGGQFVGKAACREACQRWVDSLASFEYRIIHDPVTDPLALGLTNTVLAEFELVETTRDGRTHRGCGIDVIEMKRGKLVADCTSVLDLGAEAAIYRPAAEPLAVVGAAVSK